jgi:hypothetical protein
MLGGVSAWLATMLLLLASSCGDDAPDAAPDAAERPSRVEAPLPPRRSEPPPEPEPPPRPRAVPLDTAPDLRSALRAANGSMTALWTLVDSDRGLDVMVADDGTARYRCRLDENERAVDFPYMIDSGDRFTCNADMTRCTSVDAADGSGYAFYFVVGDGGPRRLSAIVRYSGRRVPDADAPEVARFVASSGSVCRLRKAVAAARAAAPAAADMPGELWTYRHPLQGADEDTPERPAEERRRCGAEARTAAAALLHELAVLGNPGGCDHEPLSCTYSAPFAERRLFARIEGGRVVPWAVADLASLPTDEGEARQTRDVRAFLDRARNSGCGEAVR